MEYTKETYFPELVQKIQAVFAEAYQPDKNYYKYHPWLEGALGNPQARVMFIAENPSLMMVERATNPDGGKLSPEAQWYASPGDKVFREVLCNLSLKTGGIDGLGGWNCYITNVIKEADYVKKWREDEKKDPAKRLAVARIWFKVLRWELETVRPERLVILGEKASQLLDYLSDDQKYEFPHRHTVYHYAYIGERPDRVRHLNKGNPIRVQEYTDSIRVAIS